MIKDQNMSNIFQYNDYNPTLTTTDRIYEAPFAQTKESLIDIDLYKRFLKSAIGMFRTSRTYKNYKSHLMQLGLNFSQVRSNIRSDGEFEMATIEMHHNIMTIFDIALILTEHVLNTRGCVTTFDIYDLLKQEHINHRVCVVMLDKTAHQQVHADRDFIIPPSMCFGDWITFLSMYKDGITRDVAFKIMYYLDRCIKTNNELSSYTTNALGMYEWVQSWSEFNNNDILIVSDPSDWD